MKHLRRNRSTSISSPSPSSVSAPAPLSAARASHDAPLHARFTSARRGQDGSAPTLKPLVSGPVALGPRKPVQTPVPVPFPTPPPLQQQQKSSDSRKERKERKETDKVPPEKDETRKEGEKKADVVSGGEKTEVRRMPSEGTALCGSSSGATALGRHGTRVDGERVLLPARKVTRKRVDTEASTSRNEEAHTDRSTERSAQARPPKGSEDGAPEDEVRVVGERVLLPARKVTRKRADAGDTNNSGARPPVLASARTDSEGAGSSSGQGSSTSPFKHPSLSDRANKQQKADPVEKARTQANLPERQAGSNSPIAFPASPPLGSDAGVPPPIRGGSTGAAVVVADPDAGEDRFSRPKRARLHTLATSKPAPVTSEREAGPLRVVNIVEPSKPSGSAKVRSAENETASSSTPKPAAPSPSLTSQPSTSSVTASRATGGTNGAPPRRRNYSLLAAFGLPIARSTSDSDTSAAAGASTSNSNTHNAKPPTPPPPLSASPAPPPASVSAHSSTSVPLSTTTQAPATEPSKEAHQGVYFTSSLDAAPRDRRAPPELLQLQSLHLSGFNFPLEALLAADSAESSAVTSRVAAPAASPPPVPPVPGAVIDSQPSNVNLAPTVLVSDSIPGEHASNSPSDPSTISGEHSPGDASPSALHESKESSRRPGPVPSTRPAPSSPPPRPQSPPRAHAPSPPPKPARKTARGQPENEKLHNIPWTIDLDHSLLSPESDTRYPIPRRRSPTNAAPAAPSPSKNKQKRPSPPPTMPRQASPPPRQDQPAYPPLHRGPVQGRPLIFAAMAAAEAEAEIIEPKAWMAVATLEPDAREKPERPSMNERSDGSSQFVYGYPTPRSTSPKSPELKGRRLHQDITVAATIERSMSEPSADSPPTPAKDSATRRPSASNLQNPGATSVPSGLPTPPEPQSRPRTRKLSKSRSRVTRATDASQEQQQSQAQPPTQPSTLGAKPPTPVEDAPPPMRTQERAAPSRHAPQPAVNANGSASVPAPAPTSAAAAALGSPIHLRNEKPLPERRSVESIRSPPPPRVISSESPVPRRPVKVLTERQMEKLNATKGIAPNGASVAHPAASNTKRRLEQPATVSSPPPQPRPLPLQSALPQADAMDVKMGSARSVDGAARSTPKKQRLEEPASADTPPQPKSPPPQPPRSPMSSEEYAQARTRRRGKALEKSRPEGIENVAPAADPTPDLVPEATVQDPEPAADPEEPREPTFYPVEKHVAEPALLAQLLVYLSFNDWLSLSSANKAIRSRLHDHRDLTEVVLERYLRTIGYARWAFAEGEPLTLTLTDLNAYMHGVSLPPHQFARHAETYLQAPNRERDRKLRALVDSLQTACRSYTRVVLRLRAQAEAEARATAVASPTSPQRGRGLPSVRSTASINNVPAAKKSFSRSSSRAPSPTSSYSHSHQGHGYIPVYGHSRNPSAPGQSSAVASVSGQGAGVGTFRSPLFRLRRAPLLHVFVPSPEGDWLSDASVYECEKELKRAGVVHLMRPGDVVWDTAVGDEGNVGRMVWDGGYLIDLDYTYSRSGDVPKYLPTLAFPPSYFHRVVRTMGNGNPICHIDVAPWGEEIAANLQLLQDRTKTETPQGGHHMVVRWVHRSTFTIRPPAGGKALRLVVPRDVGPGPGPGGAWLVDPGWFGTVVVEAEGTNEGLADLQARCRGAFPPRATGAPLSPERAAREEAQRSVFRILREKSRPGEIWIRTVTEKERLLPP